MAELTPIDVEKVAAENPQSRFRILNAAILPPGTCAICHSAGGDGRQFIDFGKQLDWFGAVYWCTFCFAEIAKLLGFVENVATQKFLKDRRELHLAMASHNKQLQEKLDAAMVLVRNCTCVDSGIGIPAEDVPEAELIEHEDSVSNDESSDADESDSDESDSIEGPDDVSAAPGDSDVEFVGKPRRARKSAG